MAIKLAVVISHPIQHFAPMFRDLAKEPGIVLKVFYCCDWGIKEYRDPGFGISFSWDIPLLEGYEYEFLPIKKRPRSLGFFEIDNPEVLERLSDFSPDAVWVHGYAQRTSWRVLRWARGKASVLYFGDSELLSERSLLSRAVKRAVLPFFFRRCDAFMTVGDNNELYYRHYGVPDKKMFRGSFPVDIVRFRRVAEAMTQTDRLEIRKKYGLSPDGVVILFVGKFIGIKRPIDVIEAIGRLKDHRPVIEALFIGDGILKGRIVQRISELGIQDRVKLAGFVNQTDMPRTLCSGDVLVMSSEKDPHPLAVTEAMAVGNAVVASDKVGCVGPSDSARPGINALVYPCGDIEELAGRLIMLARDEELRKRMGQASVEIAWTQDTSAAVSAVMAALRSFKGLNVKSSA